MKHEFSIEESCRQLIDEEKKRCEQFSKSMTARNGRKQLIVLHLIQNQPDEGVLSYTSQLKKLAKLYGFRLEVVNFSDETLLEPVEWLNDYYETKFSPRSKHYLLCQHPLHFDNATMNHYRNEMKREDDLDGFCALNQSIENQLTCSNENFSSKGFIRSEKMNSQPCLTEACELVLNRLIQKHKFQTPGKNALVIGRGTSGGNALRHLPLNYQMSLQVAHSHTSDLPKKLGDADIIFSAAGKPGLVSTSLCKRDTLIFDIGVGKHENNESYSGDVTIESDGCIVTPFHHGIGELTSLILVRRLFTANLNLHA